MVDPVMQFLGMAPASGGTIFMLVFFAVVLALLIGLMIEGLSGRMSYGMYGNAAILLGGALAGLALLARLVQPLKHLPATTILIVAVGSAVAFFLLLCAFRHGRQMQ